MYDFDDFLKREHALACLRIMRGMTMRDILNELLKETPNPGKLARFKRRRMSLIKTQMSLYCGDDAVIGQCVEKYAKLVRDDRRWK